MEAIQMIQDIRINKDQCLGCGNCEQTCSAIFKLTYKVHAEATGKDFEKHQKKLLAAYYGCPVQAIELVADDPSLQIVWHPARVIEKKMISATAMEVRLQTVNMSFKPGQFVTVRFKDDIGFFNRAYSIVDLKEGVLTLAVTLLNGGRGSSFLGNYDVGSVVEITEPKGDFNLRDTPNPKVFVGTGTGLAPLIAMMERCPDVKKTVYFGQRKEKDLFYLERMAKIPNLTVYTCLDFADDDWTGLRGRVTEHFLNYPLTKDTEVYTCGSDPMMKGLEEILRKKRHPKNLFFRESFSNINGMKALEDNGLISRVWTRNVHVYSSLAVSALFLFFGLTGFLASRPSLFNAETRMEIPANVKLEQAELAGYLKAKLPSGVAVKTFAVKDETAALQFEDASGLQLAVDVNMTDRSYNVTESRPLPAGPEGQTSLQLAQVLAKKYPGKLDANTLDDNDKQLQFTVESVWANTTITVDKALKRYEIRKTVNRWAAALVQLHRGKLSGPLQRVLIDLTGLLMVLVTLTGMIMGVQSRNPVMRITACILVGLSIVLTVIMIINR
jgi:CDP-4-dehydro-6-deoxyglucose reductase